MMASNVALGLFGIVNFLSESKEFGVLWIMVWEMMLSDTILFFQLMALILASFCVFFYGSDKAGTPSFDGTRSFITGSPPGGPRCDATCGRRR